MGLKFSHNVLVPEEVAGGQLDVNVAKTLFNVQCSSKISELRMCLPYASNARMRMLSFAYKYEPIRVCPAFVIHCHTFALCGIVLHNKRNGIK